MEFFGDFHCHTTYSDGRNTVSEMIKAGKKKGLKKLAITDHGPNNIGTGVKSAQTYYEIQEVIHQAQVDLNLSADHEPIQVLLGAEANIIDLVGGIDIPKNILRDLDWLVIGLHPYIRPANLQALMHFSAGNQAAKISSMLKEKVKVTNTKALIASIHKYKPDCVSHPGLQLAVDLEEVSKACAETDAAFEINTGHQHQEIEDIRLAAREGVNFIVNSDSHYVETVGELAWGGELLTRAEVSADQVYNAIKER